MIDINNLTSNFNNCILYNAIIKDDYPYDSWEVQYFINFEKNGLQSQVEEYHRRSERIITKMRELGVDTDETWIKIDQDVIDPIFDSIDEEGTTGFVEAYKKLQEALTTLEDKYEVK